MRYFSNRRSYLRAGAVGSTVVALAAGLAIYLLARPEQSTPLLRFLPYVPNPIDADTFHWFDWLPTFLHAYAFTILTWAAVGFRHIVPVGIFWFSLEVAFEISQIGGTPLVNLAGTYDPADIAAAAFAVFAAGTAALSIQKQKITGDHTWTRSDR